jgi:hypothetical protein
VPVRSRRRQARETVERGVDVATAAVDAAFDGFERLPTA